MTGSASTSNSTSLPAEVDGAKLDDEMSKPVNNMLQKSRDGEEFGSGLQVNDYHLTSTAFPKEMTTEDSKLSLDSAETEHLLLNVEKKGPSPNVPTKSPFHNIEEKTEFTVLDLDRDQDSAGDRQEPPTTVTPFPSHSSFETESLTVDFFDPKSRGNELIPPSATAHELQGHEPTARAMPNNYNYLTPYEQTVSPTSEEDTTKPEYDPDEDLTTTPPPLPPRNFHPHFPNSFIPPRENEPPTNHNKLGKSSSAECRVGSVLVNGTCKSQCDMMPNYCFNGGQCFVLEGTGVLCR